MRGTRSLLRLLWRERRGDGGRLLLAGAVLLFACAAYPPPRWVRETPPSLPPWPLPDADLYLPEHTQAAPIMVIVHGGAGVAGDKTDYCTRFFAEQFRAHGFLVVAINYRLAPSYPWRYQVADVAEGMRYARTIAASIGADTSRLYVCGISAGQAVAVAASAQVPVAGIVSISGLQDVGSWSHPLLPLWLDGEKPRPAPITAPLLLVHGDADVDVPYSQAVNAYHRAQAAGYPATLLTMRGAGHGGPGDDALRREVIPQMVAWCEHTAYRFSAASSASIASRCALSNPRRWLTRAAAMRLSRAITASSVSSFASIPVKARLAMSLPLI